MQTEATEAGTTRLHRATSQVIAASVDAVPQVAVRRRSVRARHVWSAFLLLVCAFADAAVDESPYPGGVAAYLVEVDGRTMWSHAADLRLPPASLTKIMTALLVLESGTALDSVVTVSTQAARATGSRLKLRQGEHMRVRDLLVAALLKSANDACVALAEHVSGNEAKFVSLMNRRIEQLRLTHTHFTNACGHDEPTHRSSARDLSALTKVALRQPVFAEIVGLIRYRIATVEGRSWNLVNTNELVGRYEGAIGVKTGFTSNAGKCLIALVKRDDVMVMLVALNAPNRWWDSVALLDRAFAAARSSSTSAP